VLFHPYRVYVGDQPPQILFGLELRKGEIIPLMRRIAEVNRLRITSWNDTPMLEMEYEGDGTYRARQDISFPVLDFELHQEQNDPIYLWVRNGIGVTRDGEVLDNGLLNYQAKIIN